VKRYLTARVISRSVAWLIVKVTTTSFLERNALPVTRSFRGMNSRAWASPGALSISPAGYATKQ